jgi:hypothetical protein
MCSKQKAGPMPSGCCAGGECAANKTACGKPVADGRHLLPPTVAVLPDASVGLAVKEMKA